jgi:hypothetical protein
VENRGLVYRMFSLACCAALIGCGTVSTIKDQFKVPTLWVTPFEDKQAVLNEIPIGTPVDKVRSVMRGHGFTEWCSQRQDNQLTLSFHYFNPTGLYSQDTTIIVYLKREVVVDVEIVRDHAEVVATQVAPAQPKSNASVAAR